MDTWAILVLGWIGYVFWIDPQIVSCAVGIARGPWCAYWTPDYLAAVISIVGVLLAALGAGSSVMLVAYSFNERNRNSVR